MLCCAGQGGYGGDGAGDYGSKQTYGGDDGQAYGSKKTRGGEDEERYGSKKNYGGDDGEGYGARTAAYADDSAPQVITGCRMALFMWDGCMHVRGRLQHAEGPARSLRTCAASDISRRRSSRER